jgi:hypothetical protein
MKRRLASGSGVEERRQRKDIRTPPSNARASFWNGIQLIEKYKEN